MYKGLFHMVLRKANTGVHPRLMDTVMNYNILRFFNGLSAWFNVDFKSLKEFKVFLLP